MFCCSLGAFFSRTTPTILNILFSCAYLYDILYKVWLNKYTF